VGLGAAECAATQIVHCDSSRELECWWVPKPYADNSVDSRHIHAIRFMTDRMNTYPTQINVSNPTPKLGRYARRVPQPTLCLFRDDFAERKCQCTRQKMQRARQSPMAADVLSSGGFKVKEVGRSTFSL
jgi:hypothetical protein